ncbi:hypothetical protein Adt_44902 [Abeliophyllum distichum]|uniref:DUF1985 domain-containing protein n=1 Tax=Abeliophyllum distichum TaxID=126358 RepID=A0ABD1PCT5_9LAMI
MPVKGMHVNSKNEDVVKVGFLYLVTLYLFTTPYRKQVTNAMFNLVETDDIQRYAWGKDLFNNTLNYLKITLSKRTLFDTWHRLLNWTNTAIRVTAAQLEKIDFDQPDMEVRGIQPNEEERGAAYLVGLFESFSSAPIIDDDSDFVDPSVKIRKGFKATNVENPGPIRDCKKSGNLKSQKKH